jgi:hypothetical protein
MTQLRKMVYGDEGIATKCDKLCNETNIMGVISVGLLRRLETWGQIPCKKLSVHRAGPIRRQDGAAIRFQHLRKWAPKTWRRKSPDRD